MSSAAAPVRPAATGGSGPRWWIEAAGKVWGPYPQERLATFVEEGRLTASSLVGRSGQGPFGPAALDDALTRFFVGDAPAQPAPARAPDAATGPRPLLVFAALKATRLDLFEAAVAAQGESVQVAPGLWLVRARCGAAPLRNQLSRRLREGDVLWVAEADAAQAAWFALPGDTDRAVRRLLAARGD